MSEAIVNKVANSGLRTLDLETYLPKGQIINFDLKDYLFMGMILKEKDYREALQKMDWSIYQDKDVALLCSADAIIPVWAFMLAASYLQPVASEVYMGTTDELYKHLFLKNIASIDPGEFEGERIVVKGCGDRQIENFAYAAITQKLRPVVKSIMYGEPCSTVPVYKKK